MTKINSFFKNSKFLLFLFYLIPIFANAEAGKSIDGNEILLSLLFFLFTLLNQIYLTLVSVKRILFTSKEKASIFHIISIILSFVICYFYFSHPKTDDFNFFHLIVIIPSFLGFVSGIIEIDRRVKWEKGTGNKMN